MIELTSTEKDLAELALSHLRSEGKEEATFDKLFTDLSVTEMIIDKLTEMQNMNIHWVYSMTRPFLKIKLQEFQNKKNYLNDN